MLTAALFTIAKILNQPDAAAKSLQSCPTLCDPRDGSPPGSPVPGILQGRTLEWVAISFSNRAQGFPFLHSLTYIGYFWPSYLYKWVIQLLHSSDT